MFVLVTAGLVTGGGEAVLTHHIDLHTPLLFVPCVEYVGQCSLLGCVALF